MVPWSSAMFRMFGLYCVLATWLLARTDAITVSIDRSDIKVAPTRSSMIANGWRPLAAGYEDTIGTNVSPSSSLERNVAPSVHPAHPVHGKLQEHMASSDKLKPTRKAKPSSSNQDYMNPPSILGSFAVFGHAATKARVESPSHNRFNVPSKHASSETRSEYTFLIPPPKDVFRFEVDHQRKPILREQSAYVRQPVDPVRAATYFIKGYASTTDPTSQQYAATKSRPFISYAMPQLLQPPRHQPAKPFESLKINENGKPAYYRPQQANEQSEYSNEKHSGERYQSQVQGGQQLGSASTGNFYTQVNHPRPYKTSYERDPAFLVHESHEVSYVTPSSIYNTYNFRPSVPYDSLYPPQHYSSSSTPPVPSPPPSPATSLSPSAASTTTGPQNDLTRQDPIYKSPRPGQSVKQDTIQGTTRYPSTYYVSEGQDLSNPSSIWRQPAQSKIKYSSDINEVLPRVNPPAKFSSEAIRGNQVGHENPNVVYVRQNIQQQPHYQSSIVPINLRPQTDQPPEYETPESISLKHFNEQQFIIQQQLIERDRQRLAEQERQQKLEIERRQREELKKRQEELRKLIERQKERERLEQEEEEAERQRVELEATKLANSSGQRVNQNEEPPYAIQVEQYEAPRVTSIEPYTIYQTEKEVPDSPKVHSDESQQPIEQPIEHTPEPRPYRPPKPTREQLRRKKPVILEPFTTESISEVSDVPVVPQTVPIEETLIRTTLQPESVTSPPVTLRPRIRRPGGTPQRRRRPITTTEEPIVVGDPEEDFLKYSKPDDSQQQQEPVKRRRVKPNHSYEEQSVEKRPNIRKRPGQRIRVNPGEPFEAEIVTEIVQTYANPYRDSSDAGVRYSSEETPTTSRPFDQYIVEYSPSSSPEENRHEEPTEPSKSEYYTEITKIANDNSPGLGDRLKQQQQQQANSEVNIPLENLFSKNEGIEYVSSTSSSTTTSTTTSTTPKPQSTTQSETKSTTAKSQKMRPLRFGNATRPRFSIKDYKTRLDLKSRIAQMSTTESSVSPSSTVGPSATGGLKSRIRNKEQQQNQQNGDSQRETTGRYKYMSRVSYRTTTSSPSSASALSIDDTSPTTEKINRFIPKRKPVSPNVYRSRISAAGLNRSQQQSEGENYPKSSTARPENVFSSSVRRRPTMKSRLQYNPQRENSNQEENRHEPTEMSAEETSFYSTATTSANSEQPVAANEINAEKSEVASNDATASSPVPETSNLEDIQMAETPSEASKNEESSVSEEPKIEVEPLSENPVDDQSATDEELFAKASQSVADLTSSASALYDKPGMFKAVSPESRVVSPHFKISTDEPTLPIEAFFQELNKKN